MMVLGLLLVLLASASSALAEVPVENLRQVYSEPSDLWPEPWIDKGLDYQELGLLAPAPELTQLQRQEIELGKQLFFEPGLSASGQISCASCHHPDLLFADGRKVATGHNHREGKRNTPSLLNTGLWESWFWDGRSTDLTSQFLEPLTDPVEMAADPDQTLAWLNSQSDYLEAFLALYEEKPNQENLGSALARFQESLRTRTSPFDRFLQGDDQALSDSALQGLHLFRTQARCANCHHGSLLSDQRFHNLGLTFYGRKHEDLGRYLVTGKPEDVGRFRTPSLREVTRTSPWMHNGLFNDMRGLLRMYNAGGFHPRPRRDQADDPLYPKTSSLLQPLNLTAQQLDALESFLHSLSASTPRRFSVSSQPVSASETPTTD